MEQELVVNKTAKINADISKVWNAFTDPEKTKEFMFGARVESDWKVGSPIIWKGMKDGKDIVFVQGSILNIEPGMVLQYTAFGPSGKLEDIPSNYTRVTMKFAPADGSTLLTVTQDNFGGDETRYSESNSGWDYTIKGLKGLMEKQ
ncbi:MAG TPA: SRPBCC domain-containing protein [Ignavibacteria bacterium]|jgi:uncharacterized protein YndB with AHSA1/START domain